MPAGGGPDADGGAPAKLTLGQRLLLGLPRVRGRGQRSAKAPLGQRMRDAMLKAPPPDAAPARSSGRGPSLEELEARVRFADDKERLVGLLAAPIAAMIGIIVTADLISHDPAAGHKNHVSVALYHELELVVLALAVGMLVSAYFRKRILLGGAMALYGLTVFNLKYWGFGVPYVLFGAWYLVRAYRAQRDLKEATGGGGAGRPGPAGTNRPRANRRYTPPR